jgi:hypothetical protein
MEQQIREIADHIEKDAQAIKHLLWEIKGLAVEKGNCKDIWKLADKALKHITSEK